MYTGSALRPKARIFKCVDHAPILLRHHAHLVIEVAPTILLGEAMVAIRGERDCDGRVDVAILLDRKWLLFLVQVFVVHQLKAVDARQVVNLLEASWQATDVLKAEVD